MSSPNTHCDIFCRVIDNFGDAAVCWRLAAQLANEHGWRVRLYINDPLRLSALSPAPCHGTGQVGILPWEAAVDAASTVGDVVIETFGCDLPAPWLARMAARKPHPVWINLEYLSAEPWVANTHRLPSPHPTNGLVKHFFFPGFDTHSGGILRDAAYAQRQRQFDGDAFCARWGIPASAARQDELRVSLFHYPEAPLSALLRQFEQSPRPLHLLVPGATHLPEPHPRLRVTALPFLPQDGFDELLWWCDINFVRGEDSFVRAQLAGKPLVWNIYRQAEDSHLPKLRAFLDCYADNCTPPAARALRALWLAWNDAGNWDTVWPTFVAHRDALHTHAQHWRNRLFAQPDLVSNLVAFCAQLRNGLK